MSWKGKLYLPFRFFAQEILQIHYLGPKQNQNTRYGGLFPL